MINIFGEPRHPSRFFNCDLITNTNEKIKIKKMYTFDNQRFARYIEFEELWVRRKKGRRLIIGYMLIKDNFIESGSYSKIICYIKDKKLIYNNIYVNKVEPYNKNTIIAKFKASGTEYV